MMTPKEKKELIIFIMLENRCSYVRAQLILEKYEKKGGDRMKSYIGSKIIQAEPETRNGNLEGYKVLYPDGYVSWSPKDVFETAYREITEDEKELL